MANVLANLLVKLSADSSSLEAGINKAKGNVHSATSDMASKLGGVLKTGALAGGAAMAGLGIASLKMAADFEKSFAEVKTLLPQVSEEAFGKLQKDLVGLSKQMGMATSQTIPALYQAISAGVPPDNVMTFMETASKLAIGGVTTLETAVDGLSSVVNAYGSDVLSASKAADIMFTGVKLGKTTAEELSKSLFQVIPTASSLGVSFEEVTAALATMTSQGVPTSVATTQLRQALVEASKGGSELDKALKGLTGKSFGDLTKGGMSVTDIFQSLRDSMPEQEFKDLFGSVEGMNAILQITGPNVGKMRDNLRQMGDSAGATDAAFKTISETASFKFNKAINAAKLTLMELGLKALPVVMKAVEGVGKIIKGFIFGLKEGDVASSGLWAVGEKLGVLFKEKIIPAVQAVVPVLMDFGETALKMGQEIATFLAPALDTLADLWKNALGPALQFVLPYLKAAGQWMLEHKPIIIALAAAVLLLTNPWLLVAAAIAVVLAKWDEISAFFINIGQAIASFIETVKGIPIIGAIFEGTFGFMRIIVETVFATIKSQIETTINVIRDIIKIVTALIRGDWSEAWNGIKQLVSNIWAGIYNDIAIKLGAIKDLLWNYVQTFVGIISGAAPLLYSAGSSIMLALLNGIQSGATALLSFFLTLPGLILSLIGDLGAKLWQMGRDAMIGFVKGMLSVPIPNPIDIAKKGIGAITGGWPFKAAGGPVLAGVPYIVGEKGPEWFVPKMSGTIIPNGVLPATGGASSGATIVVNITGPIYGMDDFQRRVVEAVNEGRRRGAVA